MPQQVIEGFRLSPQQKHLWSIQQAGQSRPYRAQCAVRIEGQLEPAVFKAALKALLQRHEILHTTFQSLPGLPDPVQIINADSALTIRQDDLSNLAPPEQAARLDALFDGMGRQLFNFEQGPLCRLGLVKLSSTQHILLICLPALCADALTLHHMVGEISRLYAACRSNEELPDEPLQYADLAEWQHELLEADDTQAGRDYWRKHFLAGQFNPKLPFEAQVTGSIEFEPRFVPLALDPEVVAHLAPLARRYKTSLAEVLLACWQILLWRYSGQAELVFGLAGDGRPHRELAGTLGLLARYVPVQSDLEEALPFHQLLAHVTATTQEVYQWQEYFSWDHLENQPKNPDPAFFPLSFDFVDSPPQGEPTAGVTFTLERLFICLDRFKLKLVGRQTGETVHLELHYDAHLFQAGDIERLGGHFQELLRSAAGQPEAAIGALKMITPAERRQVLFEFNQTYAEYPTDRCIHHLFEAQAERIPQEIAVVFEEQQLTYAELNRRANQVAHHLQQLGVGPDTLVAIFVERSLNVLVGLLGILKAGGAYVPFDPTLPKDRLAFLLNDTQAPILLTHQSLAARLPQLPPHLRAIYLDADWPAIARQPVDNPASPVQSHNLVYVLFTSGSTGQPKGVMVEHRHLLNYVQAVAARLELPAGAKYATVSTFAADLGNTVIFPALCRGGTLYIIPHERATDSNALADYFRHHQIDVLKLVPSHLAALLASTRPEQVMPRRRLVLGGETCHWDLARRAQSLAPDCLVFNHYGPTETTVGVLTYHLPQPPNTTPDSQTLVPAPSSVPLGRPLANTQIYILDAHRQPVPVWIPGEVYIGGAGVARGYLNRPELTTERFISNPFLKDEGGALRVKDEKKSFIPHPSSLILYKSGDLARYLPDGNIEFLGRVDNQVKIRGFRIELGEVEALLGQHPKVRETVVLAREDSPGDKRLVAYIVPNPPAPPNSGELRAFLKEKLPEPMLPTAFIMLDKIPLTPNGKIDRRALPAPDAASLAADETYVAPRNAIEEALAGLWADVLGLERVGVRDDFFELGGHSLLAVRMMAQIQKLFGRDLPLATLFQGATIEHLAEAISQQPGARPQSPLVKIQPNGAHPPFFCVHPADGTVLNYVHLARHLGQEQPFYGLQVTSLDETQPPQHRLASLAANYVRAIREIQPEGPYLLGGWSMGGIVAFEIAQQLHQEGQPVELLALFDSWVPGSDPRYPEGHPPSNGQPADGVEDDLELLTDFLRHLHLRFARELPLPADDFRRLNPDEKLDYVLAQAQMLEFVFPEGGLPQLHYLFRVFKSNVQAMLSYAPQVYPGPMVLFQATEWFAQKQHPQGKMPNSAHDWRKLTTQPLQVCSVPGDHYSMLSEPFVRLLAEQLKSYLSQVEFIEVS